MTIAFFANFLWWDRKIILHATPELKFENYESVQHRLQFSGIKKEAKISLSNLICLTFWVVAEAVIIFEEASDKRG